MSRSTTSPRPADRPLHLFATLWSLRQYPSKARELSWEKKFARVRAAGFQGVMSPPLPSLEERGDLRYLAITSLAEIKKVSPALTSIQALKAFAFDVQLGDYDSKLEDMIKLAIYIRDMAKDLGLPFAIETHRNTFTETPEVTVALCRAYFEKTGETLPLCLDHSHFAVVRHLARDAFWENLREPVELLAAATQFHLRPFNGHHCQIPVLNNAGRRTPEYRDWLVYADSLFRYLKRQPTQAPVLAVPELGNAAPAYGLSCFSDTWKDVLTVQSDLRKLWAQAGRAP